jgi:hypothetical protein
VIKIKFESLEDVGNDFDIKINTLIGVPIYAYSKIRRLGSDLELTNIYYVLEQMYCERIYD